MRNATLLNVIKGWMEDHERRVPMGGVCTHPAAMFDIIHEEAHYTDWKWRVKEQYPQAADREAWGFAVM